MGAGPIHCMITVSDAIVGVPSSLFPSTSKLISKLLEIRMFSSKDGWDEAMSLKLASMQYRENTAKINKALQTCEVKICTANGVR